MATVLREKKIKSADRVLEIFEMFDPNCQSVTVMEVARRLNVPQSSTSELLGSLVRRGYLTRDRNARAFKPTARVALLGAWVQPGLFRNGRLLTMMDQLSDDTDLSAMLCSVVGVELKQVHTVPGAAALPAGLRHDGHPQLLHSPFGLALISTIFSEYVRRMVHRLNAESDEAKRVRFGDLLPQLEQIRKQGYAIGKVALGWSGVAVLLPQGIHEEQLSVGLVGPTAGIEDRRDALVAHLRGTIAQHIGPRVARPNVHPAAPALELTR